MATNINIYKHIVEFVSDLNCAFGVKSHPLELYNRFLETKVVNDEQKQIQIHIFKNFINDNSEAIKLKDYNLFTKTDIVYNKKCVIKLIELFKLANLQEQEIMWNHLLVISSLLNPNDEDLNSMITKLNDGSKEGEFLNDIFGKITNTIPQNMDTSNPMASIMNLMSSGGFADIMNTMNNKLSSGELDLNKLIGSVSQLIPKNEQLPNIGGLDLNNMLNTLNNTTTPEKK
jgi:hypothetical protein